MCVRKRNVILDYIKLTNQIILNRTAKKLINIERTSGYSMVTNTKKRVRHKAWNTFLLMEAEITALTMNYVYQLLVAVKRWRLCVGSQAGRKPDGQKGRWVGLTMPKSFGVWKHMVYWDISRAEPMLLNISYYLRWQFMLLFSWFPIEILFQILNPLEAKISSCGYCVKAVAYQYASHEISYVFRA